MTDWKEKRRSMDAENTKVDHLTWERSMTNQPPIDPAVVTIFELTREPFKEAAHLIIDLIPNCRERSLALTKLEESLMWAVKAIALHQQDVLDRAADNDPLRKADA